MNERAVYTVASLLSALLATFHITDDIVRGFENGDASTYTFIAIVIVWLYATLIVRGRWGYAIVLAGSALGGAVPYLHMTRGLAGGRIAGTNGMFFWVFTLIALGITSIFTAILAARGLWRSFRPVT